MTARPATWTARPAGGSTQDSHAHQERRRWPTRHAGTAPTARSGRIARPVSSPEPPGSLAKYAFPERTRRAAAGDPVIANVIVHHQPRKYQQLQQVVRD